jgi:maltose alpha-D-glucosyltransferase/alpha-amylase
MVTTAETTAIPTPIAASADPLWYKDAVIYQIHVRSFADGNGDGIGDFQGLIGKLDYIQQLGATCIWLLPFFPSPLKDDGYDVADYQSVHTSYGTLADFDEFLQAAHSRGLRVMIELVLNHTSDQHPWFQAARMAPRDSPQRNFYVWRDDDRGYAGTRIIFADTEISNWAFDPVAGQYYWHRFFSHQPDLNYDNPAVFEAMFNVMVFWLDRGVDAFRLDAVSYLCEREGTINENLPETHAVLKKLRRLLEDRYPNRLLLAEANQWPADVREFFGDGDECQMGFHFPLMPRMFMALKQEDRHPITEVLRQTPEIPPTCQWAIFLRNHDELTLETVTKDERDYMYDMYAADPDMRLNFGIRRRLAPLVENSRPRTELLTSLLLSLPGTPVIYYGDEIGMGDNVYLGDRNGVRTPMQWDGGPNGGFSRADSTRLYAPVISDAVYGYRAVNVDVQAQSPFSQLNWTRRLLALRSQHLAFGRGTVEFLHPDNRKVLAFVRRDDRETILVVANLARTAQPIDLDLKPFAGLTPVEMSGLTEFPKIGSAPYALTVGPYGFYWFLLEASPASLTSRRPPAAVIQVERGKKVPLFSSGTWEKLLEGNVRKLIEHDALLPFLELQPWVDSRGRTIKAARFAEWILISVDPYPIFLTLVDVKYTSGEPQAYAVPLVALPDPHAQSIAESNAAAVLAPITGARTGLICDALADDKACQVLAAMADQQRTFDTKRGKLEAAPEPVADLSDLDVPTVPVRRLGDETRQSVIVLGRRVFKLARRPRPAPHPEAEAIRVLPKSDFNRVPRLLSTVEYQPQTGARLAIGLVERRVAHQGSGWDFTVEEIDRYLERVALRSNGEAEGVFDRPMRSFYDLRHADPPAVIRDAIGGYLHEIALLGMRTADLHTSLMRSHEPSFNAQPFSLADRRRLTVRLVASARDAFDRLDARQSALSSDAAADAATLLRRRGAVLDLLQRLDRLSIDVHAIRCHNNYHLGQILRTEHDFVIVDFARPPGMEAPVVLRTGFFRKMLRRLAPPVRPAPDGKGLALVDVATMLRSLSAATATAHHAFLVRRPGEAARIAKWVACWEVWTSAAFLTAYLDRAADPPYLPVDERQLRQLLAAFVLDTTLDELRHYVDRRPDRAYIPLSAALSLTRQLD